MLQIPHVRAVEFQCPRIRSSRQSFSILTPACLELRGTGRPLLDRSITQEAPSCPLAPARVNLPSQVEA